MDLVQGYVKESFVVVFAVGLFQPSFGLITTTNLSLPLPLSHHHQTRLRNLSDYHLQIIQHVINSHTQTFRMALSMLWLWHCQVEGTSKGDSKRHSCWSEVKVAVSKGSVSLTVFQSINSVSF